MSNYTGYGTITDNTGTTDWVSVRGWATLVCLGTYDGATMTWQTKGIDGNIVSIFGGTDNSTEQAYTADHMVNVYFGTDVKVRGSLATGSGSVDVDWQIMSGPWNRD